ncbi:hypothetical protein [Gemmata sp.]|uniref:hypothetical protein n=1 Tax=Gemmata sp. TaxID=1914242 RepID=UPI003F6FCF8E
MNRFLAGAAVWGFVGSVAYFALTRSDATGPVPAQQPAPAVAAPAPSREHEALKPPVLLADVIELTDLDPLLDPPVRAAGGVPFDAEPVVPVQAVQAPERIPLSVD